MRLEVADHNGGAHWVSVTCLPTPGTHGMDNGRTEREGARKPGAGAQATCRAQGESSKECLVWPARVSKNTIYVDPLCFRHNVCSNPEAQIEKISDSDR